MKCRIQITLLVCLLIIVVLSSCNVNNKAIETNSLYKEESVSNDLTNSINDILDNSTFENIEESTTNCYDFEISNESSRDESSSKIEMNEGEPVSLTLYNINDYNAYVKNNKMFDGFIYYDMIKSIGDFEKLTFIDINNIIQYYYILRINDGSMIYLDIYHIPKEIKEEYVYPPKDKVIQIDTPLDNFLFCDVINKGGVYTYLMYNKVIYKYALDSLEKIIFVSDGIRYEFTPGYKLDFSDYKTDDEHILTCLISGNPDNVG